MWRPFLGGDEDRNQTVVTAISDAFAWRPFLGGDEDRNDVEWADEEHRRGGVPSSEGTRIATATRGRPPSTA